MVSSMMRSMSRPKSFTMSCDSSSDSLSCSLRPSSSTTTSFAMVSLHLPRRVLGGVVELHEAPIGGLLGRRIGIVVTQIHCVSVRRHVSYLLGREVVDFRERAVD